MEKYCLHNSISFLKIHFDGLARMIRRVKLISTQVVVAVKVEVGVELGNMSKSAAAG